MDNTTQYFNYLSQQIVRLNNQGIQEIKEFQYIGCYWFTADMLSAIKRSLEQNLPLPTPDLHLKKEVEFKEDLDVISITDQLDRKYYVVMYDNDELSHDPEIVYLIKR